MFGLTTELIVGSAPPERAGAASGISETGAELGGALGISILGSIGVAIYRGDDRRRPARATPGRRRRTPRAIRSARPWPWPTQLPGELGTPSSTVARDAFVQGMQAAATISAVVAVGVAILAVVALRDVGSGASGPRRPMPKRPDQPPRPAAPRVRRRDGHAPDAAVPEA